MKEKDKERRIKYLMTKLQFRPKCKLPTTELREAKLQILLKNKNIELEQFLGVNTKSKEHKERKEVFDYYYSKGFDDSQIMNVWTSTYRRNYFRKDDSMPKPERKDNQNPVTNTINWGSGGGHGSRIRVPSKKHKNRYKNFLKLFPKFEEK